MYLTKIQLEQFRNYGSLDLEFPQKNKVLVVLGENAQGKTNLLEAIFLMTISKSFRNPKASDLICEGKDYLRVKLQTKQKNEQKEYEFFYSVKPRKHRGLKIDGVKVKTGEFIGEIKAVLFTPDDISMLYDSPSVRRKYLDILLLQSDKYYLQNLFKYKKALKQRNKVLQGICNGCLREKELDVWDKSLETAGIYLIEHRKKLISEIKPLIKKFYKNISDTDDEIEIKFLPSIENKEDFRKILKEKRKKDILCQCTTSGPHRDDFLIVFNNKNAAKFCSRGEIKSIVMALKITEAYLLKEKTGITPILLLDEIFAELDAKRRGKLMELIKNHQTIVTGVEEEFFEKEFEGAEILIAKNGTICYK